MRLLELRLEVPEYVLYPVVVAEVLTEPQRDFH